MANKIISKRCPKCKAIKPISEFHKSKTKKDGHQSECKLCHIISTNNYQKTEKGKIVNRKGVKKYQKTPKGKVVYKAKMKRFYACHPNQLKATRAVNHAIRDGKLPRPDTRLCHYCPKPAQQYHHWHGYAPDHWLDVVPVCRKCHKKAS